MRLKFALKAAFLTFILWASYAISEHSDLISGIVFLMIVATVLYYAMTRKRRKVRRVRKAAANKPFPESWKKFLLEHIAFYKGLDENEKLRFENEVQVFLLSKKITGIETNVNDEDRLLVAVSAVIPVFGFQQWDYMNLSEILLYPGSFDHQFQTDVKEKYIGGMVGNDHLSSMMILSLPDLKQGFFNHRDRHNVGIHEFAHLVDRADGDIDGIPSAGLDAQFTKPWLHLIRHEMEEIRKHHSEIDPYGGTSEEEFFAVTSEYFFENPKQMVKKHPDLYKMLSAIYHQDMLKILPDVLMNDNQDTLRNDPCPCHSGKKFKYCCGATVN